MKLYDTVILAARTARTNAYLQALENNNITLKAAIFFEDTHGLKPGQSDYIPENKWQDSPVYLPDLSQSIDDCLERVCDKVIRVAANHVNDPAVVTALDTLSPEMVIYSGYGSQIVGKNILSLCSKVLHLHAGWLPEFRGSTTTYYHLLETGNCAVSALLLEEKIDMGPILARKSYPRPPSGLDIDYLYDGAIRADLLIEVLHYYIDHGELPYVEHQTKERGQTYYIIHPVLKHIALLSLGWQV